MTTGGGRRSGMRVLSIVLAIALVVVVGVVIFRQVTGWAARRPRRRSSPA